jgi:hypothetical protein
VLACLTPVPEKHSRNHKTKRRFFHELKYGSSDLDLFVYGLSEEDATLKLRELYFAIHNAIPLNDVVVFRTRHAITIVSQFPYRHVQVVLRVYQSPAEILAGFDVVSGTVERGGFIRRRAFVLMAGVLWIDKVLVNCSSSSTRYFMD